MTLRLPNAPRGLDPGHHRPRRPSHPMAVQLLVCGTTDRADDGASILAARLITDRLPPDVGLRIVGQLDIDHLLAIPDGAAAVIVDTAVGIPAGEIIDLPLDGLIGRGDELRPRSSHALAIPEVVGLAGILRGHPLPGRIVAIGGSAFGLGKPLSRRVAAALPHLADAILRAADGCRPANAD
jgi:hydrogenase maturation protease